MNDGVFCRIADGLKFVLLALDSVRRLCFWDTACVLTSVMIFHRRECVIKKRELLEQRIKGEVPSTRRIYLVFEILVS